MDEMPKISDAELEIMKLIWSNSPITSEEIISSLSENMNWSTQTIKTFINRLLNKGAIGFEKVGRSYKYYPIVSEQDYIKLENKSFLKKVYNGAIGLLLSNFLEEETLSREEIERLQELLEHKKKETHQEGKQ